jgi:hypothetical protein
MQDMMSTRSVLEIELAEKQDLLLHELDHDRIVDLKVDIAYLEKKLSE